MKNKLTDLNNHLFAEIERLSDEEISTEALEVEIKRAKAITDVSKQIIDNARLSLEGEQFLYDAGVKTIANDQPFLIGMEKRK